MFKPVIAIIALLRLAMLLLPLWLSNKLRIKLATKLIVLDGQHGSGVYELVGGVHRITLVRYHAELWPTLVHELYHVAQAACSTPTPLRSGLGLCPALRTRLALFLTDYPSVELPRERAAESFTLGVCAALGLLPET